jgi:hypothetical protein
MTLGLYYSITSAITLLYARHLNHLSLEKLTKEQAQKRNEDINFYAIFGIVSMVLSFTVK